MKKIVCFIMIVTAILSFNSNIYADNSKLYINKNEIQNSVIIEDGVKYIDFEKLIVSLGGSFQFNEEVNELKFTYNDVTYSMTHNTKWNNLKNYEYDKSKETGGLIISVSDNPKNKLVKNIENNIIKENTKFKFYIFDKKVYAQDDLSLEILVNLLDYSYLSENNCIYINKMNFDKNFFKSKLKNGMTLDEVNASVPYCYRAYAKNKKLDIRNNIQIFVTGFYLKNNSIVELEFHGIDESKLYSVKLLTSDGKFVEELL